MSIMQNLNALVETAIETQAVDMTQTSEGGGGAVRKVLPKGTYMAHFIEYIELGKVIPTNGGQPTGKPAALNVRLGFLVHNGDEQVFLNPYDMVVSNFEKAKFKQLFDRMNAKGDIRHMAQKLGQPFMIELTEEKTKAGKAYNQINFATVTDVPKFNPMDGTPTVIPDISESMLKLFLWSNPTQETWDALEIKGKDGKAANNFLQDKILAAADFEGSPLQTLLFGALPTGPDVPSAPDASSDAADAPFKDTPPNNETGAPVAPSAPAAPAAPAAPSAPSAPQAPAAPTA